MILHSQPGHTEKQLTLANRRCILLAAEPYVASIQEHLRCAMAAHREGTVGLFQIHTDSASQAALTLGRLLESLDIKALDA